MRTRIWSRRFIIFTLVSILIIGLNINTFAQGGELAEEQVLDVSLDAGDAGRLDPHLSTTAADTPILQAVWGQLFNFERPGDITSEVVPELATDWTVEENGKIWTIELREGVEFHKGYGELTAEDVKYSFERTSKPATSQHAGTPPWRDFQEAEVVDRYTIKLTFDIPYPDLRNYLAYMQSGSLIVSKEAMENNEGEDRIIGTGPFMFEEYRPNENTTLVKNPNYWQGEPYLDEIVFHYMPSLSARTVSFLTGELDITKGPWDQGWVERVEEQGEEVTTDALGPGFTGMFGFDMSEEPLDDWKVRAAIAYAIDRSELVEIMGEDLCEPQYSPVPDTWLDGTYEAVPKYEHDLEKAKALLDAAGFPDGFELSTPASPSDYYKTQYEVIQEQLARVGIDLELDMIDHTTFHERRRQGRQTLILVGDDGFDAAEPLWKYFHSSAIVTKEEGTHNFSHYGDMVGSVDDELEEARVSPPAVASELYAKIQRQVLNDLAVYPTLNIGVILARHNHVDLGYDPVSTDNGSIYTLTWETKILNR